jgi:hypothetical protein
MVTATATASSATTRIERELILQVAGVLHQAGHPPRPAVRVPRGRGPARAGSGPVD